MDIIVNLRKSQDVIVAFMLQKGMDFFPIECHISGVANINLIVQGHPIGITHAHNLLSVVLCWQLAWAKYVAIISLSSWNLGTPKLCVHPYKKQLLSLSRKY